MPLLFERNDRPPWVAPLWVKQESPYDHPLISRFAARLLGFNFQSPVQHTRFYQIRAEMGIKSFDSRALLKVALRRRDRVTVTEKNGKVFIEAKETQARALLDIPWEEVEELI